MPRIAPRLPPRSPPTSTAARRPKVAAAEHALSRASLLPRQLCGARPYRLRSLRVCAIRMLLAIELRMDRLHTWQPPQSACQAQQIGLGARSAAHLDLVSVLARAHAERLNRHARLDTGGMHGMQHVIPRFGSDAQPNA